MAWHEIGVISLKGPFQSTINAMFNLFASALTAAAAPALPAGEMAVYTQRTGKSSINVLKLYPDNTYSYCRYTKTRIGRDSGIYRLRGKKLTLQTRLKRHGSNPLLEDATFVGEKGLYSGRMPMVFSGKPLFLPSDDPKYRQVWTFNPITQNWFDQAGSASKAAPVNEVAVRQRNLAAGEAAKMFYIRTVTDMAPEYGNLLNKAYCGPDCYSSIVNGQPVPWNGDTTHAGLIGDIETVVHESVHQYNQYQHYMVIPGLELDVKRTEVFRSADFASLVPAGLPEKIFRYKTYVSDASEVSANVSGIYGLMDEYSAYLNGTRFSLLAAQTAAKRKDSTLARWYMGKAAQTYFACYEFRLFTAWYLHYAEQYRKDVYSNLMANKNLRVLFTLMDDEFTYTIAQLESMKINGRGGAWKSISSYYESLYAAPCYPELEKEKSRLDKFRISGVTRQNYTSYLEKPIP